VGLPSNSGAEAYAQRFRRCYVSNCSGGGMSARRRWAEAKRSRCGSRTENGGRDERVGGRTWRLDPTGQRHTYLTVEERLGRIGRLLVSPFPNKPSLGPSPFGFGLAAVSEIRVYSVFIAGVEPRFIRAFGD
jgi:hypothetical protein